MAPAPVLIIVKASSDETDMTKYVNGLIEAGTKVLYGTCIFDKDDVDVVKFVWDGQKAIKVDYVQGFIGGDYPPANIEIRDDQLHIEPRSYKDFFSDEDSFWYSPEIRHRMIFSLKIGDKTLEQDRFEAPVVIHGEIWTFVCVLNDQKETLPNITVDQLYEGLRTNKFKFHQNFNDTKDPHRIYMEYDSQQHGEIREPDMEVVNKYSGIQSAVLQNKA